MGSFYGKSVSSETILEQAGWGSTSMNIYAAHVGNSGTKIYCSDNDHLWEYTMSTAHDLSTASYAGTGHNLAVASGVSLTDAVRMNLTGTKLIVVFSGVSSDHGYIREYTLSTAWDLSTASLTDTINLYTLLQAENTDYRYLYTAGMDSTGKYIFLSIFDASTYNDIAMGVLSLSTAWDLSSYVGIDFWEGANTGIPTYPIKNASFVDNGNAVACGTGRGIYWIPLNTPYTVSDHTTSDSWTMKSPSPLVDGATTFAMDMLTISDDEEYVYMAESVGAWDTNEFINFKYQPQVEIGATFTLLSGFSHNEVANTQILLAGMGGSPGALFVGWMRKDDDAGGDFTFTLQKNLDTITDTHLGTSAGNDQRSCLAYALTEEPIPSIRYVQLYGVTTDTDAMASMAFTIDGVDTTTPVDVDCSASHVAADNTSTPTVPGVTTVTDGCLLLVFISSDAGAGSVTYTAPSGFTLLHAYDEAGNYCAAAYKLQTTKGATGNIAWGSSNTSAENHVALLALRPGAEALTHYTLTAGSGQTVTIGRPPKLAYSTSEDIRDDNQLGINDVDYWDAGDALITDQNSDYLELEAP